jgi:hypothetical protein
MIANMNQRIFVIAILFALSFSSACSFNLSTVRYDEERVVAYAATDRFVSLFNDRKFEEIWAMTDERAKATKSKTALIALLSGLRDDLGKIVNLERTDSLGKPGDGYVEITLQFKIKFERSDNRMSFVWYVFNGKASLFSIGIG